MLTLPLLRGLRRAIPRARIELLGKPWLHSLFEGTGICDDTHVLVPPWTRHSAKYGLGQGAWRKYFSELKAVRAEAFDLIVSCRYDARDVLQLRLLRGSSRAAFGGAGGARWLDVDLGSPPSRTAGVPVHRDAAYALMRIAGATFPDAPAFPPDENKATAALARLREAGLRTGPVVAVSLSAGHPNRRWDAERLAEVLRRTALEIGFLVVVRDPDDPASDEIRVPPGLPVLYWSSSLADLRGLFAVTDVALCCDSGVMHVASACGCRVVAIFGSAAPQWFGPYGTADQVVLSEPMPCRPCFDRCIYAQPICIKNVSVDMVESALRKAIDPVTRPDRRDS